MWLAMTLPITSILAKPMHTDKAVIENSLSALHSPSGLVRGSKLDQSTLWVILVSNLSKKNSINKMSASGNSIFMSCCMDVCQPAIKMIPQQLWSHQHLLQSLIHYLYLQGEQLSVIWGFTVSLLFLYCFVFLKCIKLLYSWLTFQFEWIPSKSKQLL